MFRPIRYSRALLRNISVCREKAERTKADPYWISTMSTQVAIIWLSAKNNRPYFVIPIPPINYYGRPMQYKFKQWEHCCRTIGSRLSGELQADQKDIIKENLMRLALVYSLIKMLLGGSGIIWLCLTLFMGWLHDEIFLCFPFSPWIMFNRGWNLPQVRLKWCRKAHWK